SRARMPRRHHLERQTAYRRRGDDHDPARRLTLRFKAPKGPMVAFNATMGPLGVSVTPCHSRGCGEGFVGVDAPVRPPRLPGANATSTAPISSIAVPVQKIGTEA